MRSSLKLRDCVEITQLPDVMVSPLIPVKHLLLPFGGVDYFIWPRENARLRKNYVTFFLVPQGRYGVQLSGEDAEMRIPDKNVNRLVSCV